MKREEEQKEIKEVGKRGRDREKEGIGEGEEKERINGERRGRKEESRERD